MDPVAESLERQWFAASSAANTLKAECDVLLGVLQITGDSWRSVALDADAQPAKHIGQQP